MVSKKRALEEPSAVQKSKKPKNQEHTKPKTDFNSHPPTTLLTADEIDFPRGGGTTLSALEVKATRAEGVKEADAALFAEKESRSKTSKKRKRQTENGASNTEAKTDKIRIEHMNYKRLNIGMKIMGQIIGILPLALLVSLPNQILAHVPITNVSPQYTSVLERMDNEDMEDSSDEEEESSEKPSVPDLGQLFRLGQYIRAVVSTTYAPGSSNASGLAKARDELSRSCKRVELTLVPDRVNEGVQKDDLKPGFTLTAAIRSVEDHGYILDLGIPEVDGFLSFKDSRQDEEDKTSRLSIGQLVDATVVKLSSNKRTCSVTSNPSTFKTSSISEISSVKSILPGSLVQALVTGISSDGLNLQIMGFFDGTVERIHLRTGGKALKLGQKVKGRILYQHSADPPRFAVSLAQHIVELGVRQASGVGEVMEPKPLNEAYPFGSVIESSKVAKIEPERGLFLEVESGLEGFVHISHISDEHVPSLSTSGPWKVNSLHRGRVTGYHSFDGLLQISLKPSIFEQKFMQLSDFKVGDVVKGTIKSVSDSALFVSLSGNIDGVIWPNHFADIKLKHPTRRFKPGGNIKCKVLVVDTERKRICLTAKKTLLDSSLPILSSYDDVRPGMVTHAVVFKVFEKHLMVEFFNNLKATVSLKESSETPTIKLSDAFPIGRVVRVRVLSVDPKQGRIVASIRQGLVSEPAIADVSAVEIGDTVQGAVSQIHGEHIVLSLEPTKVRALLSIKNLANHRKLSPAQLHGSLKVGDTLDELVVVTRNLEKGIVIVANKPKARPSLPSKGAPLTLETISVGQHIGGRITRHTRNGTLVKLSSHLGGVLHPTDTSDNYDTGTAFPDIDTIIKSSVVSIDKDRRQLTLSTRNSRLYPDQTHDIVDREINNISDLQVGDSIRGFIKNIADHGLFVTVGRGIDARVQIRELFDEFVKDWKPRFRENQLVKGRILNVDMEKNKIEMTFKSGDLIREKDHSTMTSADLKPGQKVDGVIKRIEDYGLFIDIEGSKLHGLCHKSQLSDNPGADVNEALRGFRVGDRVKVVVTGTEKGRISFSLKPSHFSSEDFEDEEPSDEDVPDSFGVVDNDEDDGSEADEVDDIGQDEVSSESEHDEAMQIDFDDPTLTIQPSSTATNASNNVSSAPKTIPSLTLSEGFQWFGHSQQADDGSDDGASSDGSDHEGEPSRKKKKKRKEIEKDFTADMQTKTPESTSDFERLLLGSPSSSYLWIQYMSFQLQISEVDKAREIARRAFKTISFREEQERLNVWIALLNLENVYGTDESIEATFKDAARANDSKTIHLRLATIFDQSGKPQKAEEQFKRTSKKFGKSCKVWTLFGEHYLRAGKIEEARKLLPRSLQSLEKRKHLKTICRFAQLEYKLGDPERGKTLFEGIMDSHPKRWDLWSIYMDMEAGQKNIQSIRNLFDRVLALKMTSHKAKSFFKKWLDIEKRIGDDAGVEVVKQKAVEWTQRAAAPTAA